MRILLAAFCIYVFLGDKGFICFFKCFKLGCKILLIRIFYIVI